MLDAYLTVLRRTPLDQHTEMTGRAARQSLLESALALFRPAGAAMVHKPKRPDSAPIFYRAS